MTVRVLLVNQLNLTLEFGLLAELLVGQGAGSLADVKRRAEGD